MAYISTEQVAEIRSELKKQLPEIKFSVVRHHFSNVTIAIMQAPYRFTEENYKQLNHFFLDSYNHSEILIKIKEIANRGNYDDSDSQTDYFDVGFYLNIHVGKYDKPFVLTEAKSKAVKPVKKEEFAKVVPALKQKSSIFQRLFSFIF